MWPQCFPERRSPAEGLRRSPAARSPNLVGIAPGSVRIWWESHLAASESGGSSTWQRPNLVGIAPGSVRIWWESHLAASESGKLVIYFWESCKLDGPRPRPTDPPCTHRALRPARQRAADPLARPPWALPRWAGGGADSPELCGTDGASAPAAWARGGRRRALRTGGGPTAAGGIPRCASCGI
eukprot:gene5442-biopygen14762